MSQTNTSLVRIATIQALISVPGIPLPNILEAEPYQPSDMSSVQCPFFVNELPVTGSNANIPISSGQQYVDTPIDMMLALARRGAALDLKYNIQTALLWRDAVLAAFAQHVRLSYPAITILASTNTNPIQVTTTIPHGLVTGDQVTITGHLVNTNANGTWTVTVIDNWNFTIPTAGNGVGGQTGTERKTQPVDLPFVVEAVITAWSLVDWEYGSTEFLALRFPLRLREMYVTTIAG